ncbi:MAG TPA: NRDE family protein [Streptosporangiaceae bacterium]
MCTVVVSLEPTAAAPLLLLGIRDEFAARPWLPPARHWSPGGSGGMASPQDGARPQDGTRPGTRSQLIGGRDVQAGGTWLAVHPDVPRVSCVLNGRGELAAQLTRRSRGELPLRGAQEGTTALARLRDDPEALASYDPFHLVCADMSEVSVLSWNGSQAALTALGPGTHMITNAGLDENDPKVGYYGARFAAHRPDADPAASAQRAWKPWLALLNEDALPATDPRAIRVRRELPDGRVWGTSSVSLIALTRTGLRYDFQPVPGDLEPVKI